MAKHKTPKKGFTAQPKKPRGKPAPAAEEFDSDSDAGLGSDDFAAGKELVRFDGDGDSDDSLDEEAVYQLDDDDSDEDEDVDDEDVLEEAMEAGGRIGRRERAWSAIRRRRPAAGTHCATVRCHTASDVLPQAPAARPQGCAARMRRLGCSAQRAQGWRDVARSTTPSQAFDGCPSPPPPPPPALQSPSKPRFWSSG